MANNNSSKSILTIIGLALLYLLLVFICEFIGFINPWCWILYTAVAAIVAAWPVFKAIEKTGGKYIFLLFAVIFVLAGLIEIGWNTIPSIIASLTVAVVAEIVHRVLGYGTKKALRVAYPIFAFVPLGGLASLWFNTARYAESAAEECGQAYGETMSHLGTFWTFAVAAVAIIAVALVAVKIFYKEK